MNSASHTGTSPVPPAPHPTLIPRARRDGWRAFAALAAVWLASQAPALAQPSQLGVWSAPQPWVYPAIHSSLLPNGKVLFWPGYTGDKPRFWDPATAVLTDAPHAGYKIFLRRPRL